MISREKILEALKAKPFKEYALLARVSPSGSAEELHQVLMHMREAGEVKFDIHKGDWRL